MVIVRRGRTGRYRQGQAIGRPFRLNKHSQQAKGLKVWWPTLGQNGILRDYAGEKHGTLEAGAYYNRNQPTGTSIFFDGDDDYVQLGSIPAGDPLSLSGDAVFSISFWYVGTDTGDSYQRIFDKSTGGGGTNGWALVNTYWDTSNRRAFTLGGSGTNYADSPADTWVANVWIHATIVKYSNTSAEWFINGLPVTTTIVGNLSFASTTANAKLGTWNHSTGRELNGQLADFRVYHRVLSPSEAYMLYDPRTRWELYEPIPRAFPMYVPVTAVEKAPTIVDTSRQVLMPRSLI